MSIIPLCLPLQSDLTFVQLQLVQAVPLDLDHGRGVHPGKRGLQGHCVTIYQGLIVCNGRRKNEARMRTRGFCLLKSYSPKQLNLQHYYLTCSMPNP